MMKYVNKKEGKARERETTDVIMVIIMMMIVMVSDGK